LDLLDRCRAVFFLFSHLNRNSIKFKMTAENRGDRDRTHRGGWLSAVTEAVQSAWFSTAMETRCFQLPVDEAQDETARPGFRLNTGDFIPPVGLDYQALPSSLHLTAGHLREALAAALEAGFTLLISVGPANAAGVGCTLQGFGRPRESVFIAATVELGAVGPGGVKSAAAQITATLGCGRLDLLLLDVGTCNADACQEGWLEVIGCAKEVRSMHSRSVQCLASCRDIHF
jgi:hypothetical protein